MRLWTCIAVLIIAGACRTTPALAASPKPNPQEIEQNVRLQIFLDNASFGPGKIDGHQGEFTRKALAFYRQSKGQGSAAPADPKAPLDTAGLDLSGVDPVFISYSVTAQDEANVGEVPRGPEAQSKVKRLPYASIAEGIAEKFHCDLDFLKSLNPGKTEKLKAGDSLSVPNVKPFELEEVKTLQPGSEAAAQAANDLGEDPATPAPAPAGTVPDKPSSETPAPAPAAPVITLHVSVKNEMLEVYAADKLIAAFPVTVGSQQTASPIGHWTVKGVARMPNFRYDPKMLAKGERSSDFHMLPPGPNNPVGVMWIALNKKGIGIHGTEEPDSIGRSASHGCIRMANWDVTRLATLVKTGVAVTVD